MALRQWMLEQLAMYAAFHRDPRNRATHHVGVPLIVFAILLALNQARLAEVGDIHLTAAQLLLGALMLLYLITVPAVGLLACAFYAVVYVIVLRIPGDWVWPVAGGTFILGWAIQFLGHAFEGRRPAFFVNALQIFMAPAFLLAEILFAFGFAQTLAADLEARAEKYATLT